MTTSNPGPQGPPDPPVDTAPHDAVYGGPYEGVLREGPRVTKDELRDLARLRRSRSDKKVAGVAGGIARHLDIDPIIVRVALVVLVFFGGAGLIVYAACWLLVPLDGAPRATVRLDDRSRTVALVIAGVLATLSLLSDSLGDWQVPWTLVGVSILVAAVLLVRNRDSRGARDTEPRTTATWTGPGSTEAPGGTAPGWTQPPRGKRRGGPMLFWYAIALSAIGAGVLGSIDLAGVAIADSAYPALVLVTCGVMLLVGAFWGRPGGLIALGLISAMATGATQAASDLDIDRVVRAPTDASSLLDTYDLDVGEIVLDLTELTDPESLDGRTVDLDVGLGRVEVVVPDDLGVQVISDLGGGESTVFGVRSDGGREVSSVSGGADAPVLVLDVHVTLGDIDIIREGDTR